MCLWQNSLSSKFSILFFSIAFSMIALSSATSLEAAGWGKNDKVTFFEENEWNGVYLDIDDLHFEASLPNYAVAQHQNEAFSLFGEIGNCGYAIVTSLSTFIPPKDLENFVEVIQEANPGYVVKAIDVKMLGAMYAVDLIPADQEDAIFWRFILAKNRLIKMGTDHINEGDRLYFFESILFL